MKDFSQEIYRIFNLFKKGKPFAFSKFADGEWAAIVDEKLNNSEFSNDIYTDQFFRDRLIDSLKFL